MNRLALPQIEIRGKDAMRVLSHMASGGDVELREWLTEKYVPMLGGSGSFSDYAEPKILDHLLSDGAFTEPANVYLALCTTLPDDTKTGVNIVEATYTGYARLEILASDLSAAAAGSKTNSAALTFAACTASSSTIVGWAVTDNATTSAGNSLCWGSCTSTVISTTATPPTVDIGGLVVTLD